MLATNREFSQQPELSSMVAEAAAESKSSQKSAGVEGSDRGNPQSGLVLSVCVVLLSLFVVGVWAAWHYDQQERDNGGLYANQNAICFGRLETPIPPVLNKPMQVTYSVKRYKEGHGGPLGKASAAGEGTGVKNAKVTFSLKTGDASVDGKPIATIMTDEQGNAAVTLMPVAFNGRDQLNVQFEFDSEVAVDPDRPRFEVHN